MTSNTLLAIISCPKDNELVARHWPYFKLTGFDIAGIGTVCGGCRWPEDVMQLNSGQLGKKVTNGISAIWGLVPLELDILEAFLQTNYKFCMIVEADNLFVRKPPEHPGHMLYLCNIIANLHAGIFRTSCYFSTPRYCDRETAAHLVHWGRQMIARGDHEAWISDRFMAHVAYTAKLRFQHYPSWTSFPFSWSGMDIKEAFVKDARTAISLGAVCLHGIKNEATLKAVTEGFDILPKPAIDFATFQQDESSYYIHPTCQVVNLGAHYENVFGIGKNDGRYVEVGAFTGAIYSNVYGLALAGWKGIAIEPMPENLGPLREAYANLPNIIIEPVAASSSNAPLVMFSEREGSRLKEETNPRNLPIITVESRTLDSILEKHNWEPDFELLVIDTEGHEEDVMTGFTVEKWRPKLIIMETAGRRPKLHNLIKNRYDILFEDGLNTLFIRRESCQQ